MKGRMKKKPAVIGAAVVLACSLSGCEAMNGGITNSSSKIADGILKRAEAICGEGRDHGPHDGIVNIMLMDGREDDGIVTCADGHSEYFDA